MEKTAELAFFPAPGVGHLVPMVELAKLITTQDHRISITLFVMNRPFHSKINSYVQSLLTNQPPPRVRFVLLPLDEAALDHLRSTPPAHMIPELIKIHKSSVREILSDSDSTKPPRQLTGFVLDFFCIPFMEVAAEFGVPAYVFFTCGVGTLSLLFHLQSLQDDENCDMFALKDSDTELQVPGFANSVPAKVLPSVVFEKNSSYPLKFLDIPRALRKTRGILVNTFAELEPHAIRSLSNDVGLPPIYAVGPVLNLNPETIDVDQYEDIMTWLDIQPMASVVFLCFGSIGTFEAEQVVEIANALEQSGHRFLWSLRRPPSEEKTGIPTEYEDFGDVLPEGFMERTKDIGKLIGWAPQVAVLSHESVGGFVSHCGWNSTLESLWCGVPLATWPLYAEQQLNAFDLVKELGLAVEIKLDYRKENPVLVTAEEITRGINQLMEGGDGVEITKRVKAISKLSRMTVVEGGSSYVAVGHFVEEVLNAST